MTLRNMWTVPYCTWLQIWSTKIHDRFFLVFFFSIIYSFYYYYQRAWFSTRVRLALVPFITRWGALKLEGWAGGGHRSLGHATKKSWKRVQSALLQSVPSQFCVIFWRNFYLFLKGFLSHFWSQFCVILESFLKDFLVILKSFKSQFRVNF